MNAVKWLYDNPNSVTYRKPVRVSYADVFRTMQKRAKEVERLHRFARHRPEWAFRHNTPGFFSICNVEVESALDVHMTVDTIWNWVNCGAAGGVMRRVEMRVRVRVGVRLTGIFLY